jgi:multiple sugar transport system substrate-binding protein
MLRTDKLAIALDGSWMPTFWGETAAKPWPQWSDTIGVTKMPTQNGQEPGAISLSGGWTWALSAKSANPDQAFDFVKWLQNEKNATKYTVEAAQIAVRTDVAKDPAYVKTTDKIGPLSEVVAQTQYRPAYAEYPRISNEIQVAAESVMTGQSPERAAQAYDRAVKRIVGDEKTVAK